MTSDDRDLEMEQRLRDALAATAETVHPGGDALMRIQQRIGDGRSRRRWLRPVLAVGSVVVVVAAVIGGIAIARNDNNAKVTPAHSTTPTANGEFPAQGFFPFTTAAEEAAWEQQYADGHSPWISDPGAVSESWVQNYLKQGADVVLGAKSVAGSSADVTMTRRIGGTEHPVTVVHLVKFGQAWIVTGASAPDGQLRIASPRPGESVTSPLTVSGPGYGVDERATVELRDAETPALLGQAQTGMFGNGTAQWSASVPFAASNDGFGVIVVSVDSPADGGVGVITAEKVEFTEASPAPSTAPFYGVQGGAIERFDASGKPQGPVGDTTSLGTVSEVQRVGGAVFFTVGAAGCPAEIRSFPVGGGASVPVASADHGYGITGFGVSGDGARVAFFESGCGSAAGQGKLVFSSPGGVDRTIDFPSLPPVIVGGPVWESDGVHVDAFVRTGMEGYLARYNSTKGNNPMPSANACPGYDVNNGLPGAVTTAPDGTLWFAVQTGTSMQVWSCANAHPTVVGSVAFNDTPGALAVDGAGDFLLTDTSGKLWRAMGQAGPEELSTPGAVTSVSW